MASASEGKTRAYEYELGHSDREIKRLRTQAKLVDPMTRQFFKSAGLEAGMRVLDIGSGAGDVAFLAAEMVGPSGEVVGVDRSPAAVAAAQANARAHSPANVSFLVGDPTALDFGQPFDALVGRYVLMFSPDPASLLKSVAGRLRPDGLIVFHELGCFGARSFPPAPLYDRCYEWIVQTFRKVGSNPQMCLDLYSVFLAAGLPAPTMGLQSLVGGASSRTNGLDLIADLAATMSPVMEQMGVATLAEVDPETLYDRMKAEVEANGSVVLGRYEIGAWTRDDGRHMMSTASLDDDTGGRRLGVKLLHQLGAQRQHRALVDRALVGEFAGVERGRVVHEDDCARSAPSCRRLSC